LSPRTGEFSSGEAADAAAIGEAHWFFYRGLKQSVMGRAVLNITFETVIGHLMIQGMSNRFCW
jgi:hypothetical protein